MMKYALLLAFIGIVSPISAQTLRTPHFIIDVSVSTSDARCYAHGLSLPSPTINYLNAVASTAEDVWNSVVVSSGFRLPPGTAAFPTSDAQKITIVIQNRPIEYFAETSTAPVAPSIICIDDSYSETGWTTTGLDAMRTSLAHEFLHAVQQSYISANVYNPTTMDWIWEGTGAWMEDEYPHGDSVNTYLPSHENYAGLLLDFPEVSLDQRSGNAAYGTMLFYKYLSERGISIRQWFENLSALGLATPNNAKALDALGDAIKLVTSNRRPFDIYGDFSAAVIAKTGPFGFSDDGADQLQDAARVARSTETDANAHNFVLGTTPSVPHLSSRYITVAQPSLLDKPSMMLAKLTVHGPVWSPKSVTLPFSTSINAQILDMAASKGKRVAVSTFGVTMSAPQSAEIKEVVVSVANVSPTADKSLSAFESMVAPNFRDVYTPNPANGTTKTVKNILASNTVPLGTVLKLDVKLSAVAVCGERDPSKCIKADFSQVDTAFNPSKVSVSGPVIDPLGAVYTIIYPLSYTTTATSGTVKIQAINTIDGTSFESEDTSFNLNIGGQWDYLWDAGQAPEEAGWIKSTVGRPVVESISPGIFRFKIEGTERLWYDFHSSFLQNRPLTIELKLKNTPSAAFSTQVNSYVGSSDQFVLGFFINIIGLDKVGLDYVVEPFPPGDYTNFFMDTKDIFHVYRLTMDTAKMVRLYTDGILRLQAQATTPSMPNDVFHMAFFYDYEGFWDYVAFKGGAALDPSVLPSPPTAPPDDALSSIAATLASSFPSTKVHARNSFTTLQSADSVFRIGEIYSYPNPAKNGKNPTIHIECGIADEVGIKIYDMSGELVNERQIMGDSWKIINDKFAYEYIWNTSNVPSGVYAYTIKAEKSGEKPITVVRKLAVIK
ncbi:MAG: T9SS type A sorting domain-containing protein [Elusimicrobia bacterium]|nr:T9SS type A sorting domain-containing protein [Elusimicrobiota bacterium]